MTATPHGPLDHVLDRLEGVRPSGSSGTQFVAQCPAHDDSRPSLSVRLVGQAIYLKCFVGCKRDAILKRLDLKPADLRLPPGVRAPQTGRPGRDNEEAHHIPRGALQPCNTPLRTPGDSGAGGVAHTATSAPASTPSPTAVACTVAAYAERKGLPWSSCVAWGCGMCHIRANQPSACPTQGRRHGRRRTLSHRARAGRGR